MALFPLIAAPGRVRAGGGGGGGGLQRFKRPLGIPIYIFFSLLACQRGRRCTGWATPTLWIENCIFKKGKCVGAPPPRLYEEHESYMIMMVIQEIVIAQSHSSKFGTRAW